MRGGLLKLHDPAPAIILDLSMLNQSLSVAGIMRLEGGGKEGEGYPGLCGKVGLALRESTGSR